MDNVERSKFIFSPLQTKPCAAIFLSSMISIFSTSSDAAPRLDVRNTRHCEIILLKKKLYLSVYSTIGLNDCPETIWKKIRPGRIKRDTGTFFAHLSGPRYWVVDGFEQSNLINSDQKILGGITMREAGVLHLTLMDILKGAEPYREHKIERQTTWIYKAGHPVYELINPKGQVFVMQSYSVEVMPLTEASLTGLEAQLTLPKGWQFRTMMLTQDKCLTANNKSVVIMDSLLNTYQLAEGDFHSGQVKTWSNSS